MIRTQISLDQREYLLAKKEARSIRKMLPPAGQGPWMRYAGLVESGDTRSSQSIDEVVYTVTRPLPDGRGSVTS